MKTTVLTDENRRARAAENPSPPRRPTPASVTKTGNQSHLPEEETRKSFLLRISPDLWKEVEGWAQAELRSVNGQIEYLLRQAVSQRRRK
ncbi:MAG TPA: hypothetical protein VHC95_09280 [Opitutales bacterium]|nr:hypothetical protein [Opitutales bacterium]